MLSAITYNVRFDVNNKFIILSKYRVIINKASIILHAAILSKQIYFILSLSRKNSMSDIPKDTCNLATNFRKFSKVLETLYIFIFLCSNIYTQFRNINIIEFYTCYKYDYLYIKAESFEISENRNTFTNTRLTRLIHT